MILCRKVEGFVKTVLEPHWRKTRLNNLVLLVTGILVSHSMILSEISRAFPGEHKDKHKLRRLWRFLRNQEVRPDEVFPHIIQAVVSRWPPCLPLPILLDWTHVGEYDALVASVPWCGRSHVIFTRAVPAGKWRTEDSRNLYEEHFLQDLLAWLPQDVVPVFVADRGFGRLSLFRFLATLPRRVEWVIRVKAKTTVQVGDQGYLLRDLAITLGESRGWRDITYMPQEEGGLVLNLAVAWQRRYRRQHWGRKPKEPWYLVTSLASFCDAVAMYRRRMRIELTFRDWKSRLDLRHAQVQDVARMSRLLLGLVIAYLILSFIGLFGITVRWKKRLAQHRRNSYIWEALQFLRRAGHSSITQAFAIITPAPTFR